MNQQFFSRERLYEIKLEKQGDTLRAWINEQTYHVEILNTHASGFKLKIDGHTFQLNWAEDKGRYWIAERGRTYLLEAASKRNRPREYESEEERHLRAPMPAHVHMLAVAVGDFVQKGQTLLILEAMKMEIRITAERDGRIVKVFIEAGQTITRDELLIEIEPILSG